MSRVEINSVKFGRIVSKSIYFVIFNYIVPKYLKPTILINNLITDICIGGTHFENGTLVSIFAH